MPTEAWLKKVMIKKLRANVALAAWAGADTLGDAKIYYDDSNDHAFRGDTESSFRYIVFFIEDSSAPMETYDGAFIESWDIGIAIIDKSDGSSDHVDNGYGLLKAVFESRCAATLDDAAYPEYTTTDIKRMSSLVGPTRDVGTGAWIGTVRYTINAQKA